MTYKELHIMARELYRALYLARDCMPKPDPATMSEWKLYGIKRAIDRADRALLAWERGNILKREPEAKDE